MHQIDLCSYLYFDLLITVTYTKSLHVFSQQSETEKQARDHQISTLQGEMQNLDAQIAKLIREKKMAEESNRSLSEQLQVEEDKVNHLNKLKQKMEANLDEVRILNTVCFIQFV